MIFWTASFQLAHDRKMRAVRKSMRRREDQLRFGWAGTGFFSTGFS